MTDLTNRHAHQAEVRLTRETDGTPATPSRRLLAVLVCLGIAGCAPRAQIPALSSGWIPGSWECSGEWAAFYGHAASESLIGGSKSTQIAMICQTETREGLLLVFGHALHSGPVFWGVYKLEDFGLEAEQQMHAKLLVNSNSLAPEHQVLRYEPGAVGSTAMRDVAALWASLNLPPIDDPVLDSAEAVLGIKRQTDPGAVQAQERTFSLHNSAPCR